MVLSGKPRPSSLNSRRPRRVAVVCFRNNLRLRGRRPGRRDEERPASYPGGFAALADMVAETIRSLGSEVRTNAPVNGLRIEAGPGDGGCDSGGDRPRE